jgi:glycerophosphoryl diester phosphodiesterase
MELKLNKIKIFAHRGFSCFFPEDSIVAFEKAIELGADGVECDVQKTADGRIVLMHDPTIDRTTTGHGLICKMKLDEIRKFSLKSVHSDSLEHAKVWHDQKVPSLENFLELVKPSSIRLRIEIKEVGIEEQAIRLIKAFNVQDRTTVISFFPPVLVRIKEIDPNIQTSLLTTRFAQVPYNQIKPYINAVDFQFGQELNRQFYDQARRDGMELDFWTIDTIAELQKSLKWKPDCITTNFPHKIMKELNRSVPAWADMVEASTKT